MPLSSAGGYVIPEDVRAVCYEVLRHRIGLTYEAEGRKHYNRKYNYRDNQYS